MNTEQKSVFLLGLSRFSKRPYSRWDRTSSLSFRLNYHLFLSRTNFQTDQELFLDSGRCQLEKWDYKGWLMGNLSSTRAPHKWSWGRLCTSNHCHQMSDISNLPQAVLGSIFHWYLLLIFPWGMIRTPNHCHQLSDVSISPSCLKVHLPLTSIIVLICLMPLLYGTPVEPQIYSRFTRE